MYYLRKRPSLNEVFGGLDNFGKMFNYTFTTAEPKMEIIQRKDEVTIKVEVPGIKKENLQVSLQSDEITITGEYSNSKEEDLEYYYSERSATKFTRTMSLPIEVDKEQAKAKFENGLLTIVIPKLKSSKEFKINID